MDSIQKYTVDILQYRGELEETPCRPRPAEEMPAHVIALAHDYLNEPFSRKLVQGHSVLGLVLLIDPFTPEWLRGGQLYYYSVLCI